MLEAMRGTATAVAAMIWATAGATVAARAEPAPEAARIFQEGRELAKQGRFSEACALFANSYDLDPGLGTAINLADCLEHQGHLRRAWELFDVVARNSQNNLSRARLARQRADALVAKLATVVVTLHEPRAAGLAIRLGDREMPPAAEIRDLIEPRDVELVATAPGRPVFRKTLHAVAGATVIADVPAFAPLPDEAPATRRQRSRVYIAGGLGAAGALSLGAALGLALSARHIYDGAFPGECTRDHGIVCTPAGNATIDRAGRRADLATGFAVAGALLAGAAAAVFFTAPRETVVVPLTAGPLGIGVVGRF
jgi:tetratricopeptide (TPR) repeat protein